MKKAILSSLVVLLFLLSGTACAQFLPAPTEIPAVIGPIKFPDDAHYSLADVRKGVLTGILRHGWVILADGQGVARAKLDRASESQPLVVDVIYDTHGYKIKYVSSDELQGTFLSYPRWVNSLSDLILLEVKIAGIH
jgi:predicted small lipoprotein YifL